MEFSWADALRATVGILIVYAWGIAMLNITLSSYSAEKKKRITVWLLTGAGVAVVSVAGQWLYEAVNYLTINIDGDDILTFGVLLLLGILNLIATFTATVGIVIAAKTCYTNANSTKVFTAILLGLGTLVISGYLCPLLELVWAKPDEETGSMIPVHIVVYLLIHVFWTVVIYLLYRRFLLQHLRNILDTPDGNMDNFVKVPIMSCITLGLTMALGDAFGLSSYSAYFMNRCYRQSGPTVFGGGHGSFRKDSQKRSHRAGRNA